MANSGKKTFEVVSCGRDEYPGDGLRIRADGQDYEKHFISRCGVEVCEGDEVEVSVRVVSRVQVRRVPVE